MKKSKKKEKRENNEGGKLLIGEFIANEKGFGFVSIPETKQDIFIPKENIGDTMNSDIVSVKITKKAENGRRMEGKIIEIIKRNVKIVVGTYQRSQDFGFVLVDDKYITGDIYISKKYRMSARNNDKVVVEIIKYPDGKKRAEGKIIEVLGNSNDTKIDLLTILRMYEYNIRFPQKVINEVSYISNHIENVNGRVDLREEEIFTIDGDDTKDIDDAVSIKKEGNKYILGVHIADVSHYVKENTMLDKEAVKRGTSVYLIDTVIPMLPKELSNGICSLNPNEDRYTISLLMTIDKTGKVEKSEIYKSVIKSKIQMTYNNVYKILEKDEIIDEYKQFINSLKLMKELALILMRNRHNNGSIDFNLPEAKIILDKNDKAIDIMTREITIANKIIEEFMVIANETIAEKFNKKELPFIYRIHEKPDEEKIAKLNVFLNNLNCIIKPVEDNYSKYFQDVIEKSKGKEEEKVISTMILRTMKLAKYSNENIGHFGLTSNYYCHFTSPIRRYPDLFIHRMITYYLDGKMDSKNRVKYLRQAAKYAEISSDMERKAEEAERELETIKKCEYMLDHIGEEYDGIISSVTSFGIFIELLNTVEGFVHVENMKDDYYIFDEYNVLLLGQHNKKTYKIGDKIKVKVCSVDKLLKRIDFEVV